MNHLKDDWPPIVRPLPPAPEPPMSPQKPSAWTTQKPTKSGWYWLRRGEQVEVVKVRWWIGYDSQDNELDKLKTYFSETDGYLSEEVKYMPGEWAGPLEVPQ